MSDQAPIPPGFVPYAEPSPFLDRIGPLYQRDEGPHPAFGLLVGLAVWRLVVKDAMAGAALYLYLILMTLASGFIAAAGYFGGELLLSGGQP